MSHSFYMQQAIAIAKNARFHAPPNPWVGCVIVKHEQIVGYGCTQAPGNNHAEVEALQMAGAHAKDASLYVTLEPCAHTGRTPPCTQAIIRAGIKKVYVGIEDPDEKVRGRGIQALTNAGIPVKKDICADLIRDSLAPYIHHRRFKKPYVIIKTAISMDGKIAAQDCTSQWITCEKARQDVHLQRALAQAIVIGAHTALKDQPRLTVRHPDISLKKQPMRVLLDAKGKVPAKGPLFDVTLAPTLVVTTQQVKEDRVKEWETSGVEVIFVESAAKGVNLQHVWQILGERSILQAFVEGGAVLETSLLQESLFNELLIYTGPKLVGVNGLSFFGGESSTLSESMTLTLQDVVQLGQSIRARYIPLSL